MLLDVTGTGEVVVDVQAGLGSTEGVWGMDRWRHGLVVRVAIGVNPGQLVLAVVLVVGAGVNRRCVCGGSVSAADGASILGHFEELKRELLQKEIPGIG